MLTALVVLLRSIGLICRGHRAVALENLALRQQLAALTRTVKRPQLRKRERPLIPGIVFVTSLAPEGRRRPRAVP
jgi:hypothetical protein